MRELHPVQAIEPRQQGMRVALDVRMVGFEDVAEELVLGVVDGLDDEAVVAREVEEAARLARRAELGEDVLRGERDEVVGRVELEVVLAQLAEDERRVVFELEVVLCGRREFVTDTARRLVRMPT